jgi:hypothetical protein
MTMPEGLNRPPDDRIVRLQRPAGNGRDRQPDVAQLVQHLKTMFEALAKGQSTPISRPQLYMKVGELVNAEAERNGWELTMPERRQLIAELVASLQLPAPTGGTALATVEPGAANPSAAQPQQHRRGEIQDPTDHP